MHLKPQNPESPPPVFFTIPSALPIHFTWVYTTRKMETDLGCKGLSQRHASFLIMHIDTSPSNPPCFKILLDPCSRISDDEREATPLLGYTKWGWPKPRKRYSFVTAPRTPAFPRLFSYRVSVGSLTDWAEFRLLPTTRKFTPSGHRAIFFHFLSLPQTTKTLQKAVQKHTQECTD